MAKKKVSKFSTKQTGVIAWSDLKNVKGKVVYWTFFSILCVVALFSVVPAIWTVLTAFKDTQEIYTSFSFFPKAMSWDKFVGRISESWNTLQLGKAMGKYCGAGIGKSCIYGCGVWLWRICFIKIKTKRFKVDFCSCSMDNDDACSNKNSSKLYILFAFPVCF